MKPWMTEAIGTQKVDAPSAGCHADLATSEKCSMPARSFSDARWPLLNSSSEAPNGRQVMRSPAEPASSLALSAALYAVGAEGENTTLMPALAFSKAGISFSFQIGRSSFRQL